MTRADTSHLRNGKRAVVSCSFLSPVQPHFAASRSESELAPSVFTFTSNNHRSLKPHSLSAQVRGPMNRLGPGMSQNYVFQQNADRFDPRGRDPRGGATQ
jgi:hypothetical protein